MIKACPECMGLGSLYQSGLCPVCLGAGEVPVDPPPVVIVTDDDGDDGPDTDLWTPDGGEIGGES